MHTDGLEGIEWQPEPDEPRIVSAVDAIAPSGGPSGGLRQIWSLGHDHGGPVGVRTGGMRRRSPDMRRVSVLVVGVLVAVAFWQVQGPLLGWFGGIIAEELRVDTEWPYVSTRIRDLAANEQLDGSGIRVCIVDTGIEVSHPDLAQVDLVAFRDFITDTTEPVDRGTERHGTMMTGILMANSSRLTGAAPNVHLIVAAALGQRDGSGSERDVADAIQWCVEDHRADVVSLSLGGAQDIEAPLTGASIDAVQDALAAGVYVVAAAGNDGGIDDDGDVSTPANVEGVIAVGASGLNGTIWPHSSRGSTTSGVTGETRVGPHQKPEIVAPGEGIISTGKGGSLWQSAGTSDATVFVTGALALILQDHPTLRPGRTGSDYGNVVFVKQALADSARPNGGQVSPHDPRYGYGHLDAVAWHAAVTSALT